MASAKSCENALKDITFYVILNLANLGTVNFIKLTWFIAIYIMRAWIAQLKNIHQMQWADRMHLCKSIRTNRVVWYTNMASPKSCENAFKDIKS